MLPAKSHNATRFTGAGRLLLESLRNLPPRVGRHDDGENDRGPFGEGHGISVLLTVQPKSAQSADFGRTQVLYLIWTQPNIGLETHDLDSDDEFLLSGSVRLGRSVFAGTRTERLPFPCHPKRHYAFLAEFDPAVPLQYWEQTCEADWMCGRQYRFEHRHRVLRWYPILGLTDRMNRPAMPLDPFKVAARLLREREAG